MLGRTTRLQQTGNPTNTRKITLGCKTKVPGSRPKYGDFNEAFVFHAAGDQSVNNSNNRRVRGTAILSKVLSERFGEFNDKDSILGKIGWLNKSTWVSIINPADTIEKRKESAKLLAEFATEDICVIIDHFQV